MKFRKLFVVTNHFLNFIPIIFIRLQTVEVKISPHVKVYEIYGAVPTRIVLIN